MKHFIKTRAATMLLLLMIATASCTVVGTLNPIYTNSNEFIIKKELVGKWIDPKDKNGHLIVNMNESSKTYSLYMISKNDTETNDTTHLIGHIVNNNGTYFLECWYKINDEMKDLVIPRHFLAKISFITKDKVEFSLPDAEFLKKLIDEKKLQLKYAEQYENEEPKNVGFLITDKTTALQKAVTDIKKYTELFKDKVTLTRSE